MWCVKYPHKQQGKMIDCLGETVKLCNMLPGTQSKLTETTGNKQLFLGNICSNRSQKDSDRCVIFFFFFETRRRYPHHRWGSTSWWKVDFKRCFSLHDWCGPLEISKHQRVVQPPRSLYLEDVAIWLTSLDGDCKAEFYNWSNVEFTASGDITISKWSSCSSWTAKPL